MKGFKQFKIMQAKEDDPLVRLFLQGNHLKTTCKFICTELDYLPKIEHRTETFNQGSGLITSLLHNMNYLWHQDKELLKDSKMNLRAVLNEIRCVVRFKTKHGSSGDNGVFAFHNFRGSSISYPQTMRAGRIDYNYLGCCHAKNAGSDGIVKPYTIGFLSMERLSKPQNRGMIHQSGSQLVLIAPEPEQWDLFVICL
jgi:hypothetical protein